MYEDSAVGQNQKYYTFEKHQLEIRLLLETNSFEGHNRQEYAWPGHIWVNKDWKWIVILEEEQTDEEESKMCEVANEVD